MRRRFYADSVHLADQLAPDWRWQRALQLSSGDPAAGRYADDAITLFAVEVQLGEERPELDDVRKALGVFQVGGSRKRSLEAFLLTDLSPAGVGEQTGLSEQVVTAYHDVFFAVRGGARAAVWARLVAETLVDPMVRWSRFGHLGVQVRAAMEAGEVPPEWEGVAERMELAEAMDRLAATDLVAFLRAVNRLWQIDGG